MGTIAHRRHSLAAISAALILLQLAAACALAQEPSGFRDIDVAFELADKNGEVVDISRFQGKNVLLTFGFTSCAHICPTIAATMARAIRSSNKPAVGVFISVDTERDSAAITHAYAQSFSDAMIGVSGSHEQIVAAAKNFNVSFVVTKSDKNYTVQHTTDIFLIDPEGALIDSFPLDTPADRLAQEMR